MTNPSSAISAFSAVMFRCVAFPANTISRTSSSIAALNAAAHLIQTFPARSTTARRHLPGSDQGWHLQLSCSSGSFSLRAYWEQYCTGFCSPRLRGDFPMRCLSCKYDLKNLRGAEHRCPECGREFDPNDSETFETSKGMRLREWRRYFRAAGLILLALMMLNLFLRPKSPPDWYYVMELGVAFVAIVTFMMLRTQRRSIESSES